MTDQMLPGLAPTTRHVYVEFGTTAQGQDYIVCACGERFADQQGRDSRQKYDAHLEASA